MAGEKDPVAASEKKAANDPSTEVLAQPHRRRFTAKYKLKILQKADACEEPCAIGARLRKEGLYSSHLVKWRELSQQGALAGLEGFGRKIRGCNNRGTWCEGRLGLSETIAPERRERLHFPARSSRHYAVAYLGYDAQPPARFCLSC